MTASNEMTLVNELLDWGARRKDMNVQGSYKNIMKLRSLCDEAADAITMTNVRLYALAISLLPSKDSKDDTYAELKRILSFYDPESVTILENLEKVFEKD